MPDEFPGFEEDPEKAAADVSDVEEVQVDNTVVDPEMDRISRAVSDTDEDSPISIDDVLGLVPAGPKDEQDVEDAQVPADDTEPERREPESRLEARLRELAEDNKQYRDENRELVKRLLDREKPGDKAAADDAESGEPLSDEVKEYFKQYGLVTKDEVMSELGDVLEPLRRQQHDQKLAEHIGQFVSGFKAEHMSSLYQAIEKASEQDQALYRDGVAGAILLAKDLSDRGTLDLGQKKQKPKVSPLARRHHSEGAGTRPPSADSGTSDDEKLRRLMAMPNEDIRSLLERLEE